MPDAFPGHPLGLGQIGAQRRHIVADGQQSDEVVLECGVIHDVRLLGVVSAVLLRSVMEGLPDFMGRGHRSVQTLEPVEGPFDILQQHIRHITAEPGADDKAQDGQRLAVGWQGVGGDQPAPFPQFVG